MYMARQRAIIQRLLAEDSDIVCLQEFWVGNAEVTRMYREALEGTYQWLQLERTGGRGDGLVTLLKHGIRVCDKRDIMFRDLGDRVAMLLRLYIPQDRRLAGAPGPVAVEGGGGVRAGAGAWMRAGKFAGRLCW
jgi:hypothetical protein